MMVLITLECATSRGDYGNIDTGHETSRASRLVVLASFHSHVDMQTLFLIRQIKRKKELKMVSPSSYPNR